MASTPDRAAIGRRTVLKAAVATAAGAAAGRLGLARPAAEAAWVAAVLAWLEGLARPDGGYAWDGQNESHLTSTYAAIGCYRALGRTPPRPRELAAFVRTHHPSALKKLEQPHRVFDYQQVRALTWLGEDASDLREAVRGWTTPLAYMARYERHGYPVFQSEASVFRCRELLGLPLEDLRPHFVPYLDARRRGNGSFNNTPAADGGDGHVMNTWWGLRALGVLGRHAEAKQRAVAWLGACQLACGGFTYQPGAEIGAVDDAAYTWAAVRALHLLGSAPADRDGCLRYLRSLWNADGGFGDRPGWVSNPMATYCAVDALAALDALGTSPEKPAPARRSALPDGLEVFSIQLEAHGRGSPAEAVDLADALRIHLWGAKNALPGWIARAQGLADARKAPVSFFVADEEYGTWLDVPGLGTYSHVSDVIAPAGADFGAPLAGKGAATWPQFRQRRLEPLRRAGGRLIWQFGENEELVRLLLDDSLLRGGYAAVSTFHFGNPDFTHSEPFLHRWRGRLPLVALQDAHGDEPWWFADMTAGFRTLFLAREPTWAGWLEALEAGRVVAVRHDARSGLRTWMHAPSPEVAELVRRRAKEWQWWDNPAVRRPLVSLVAVTPADEFEAARPARGVALRVRCAWENTTQGMPKRPLAELVKLTLDGRDTAPKLVTRKGARGAAFADHYHLLPLTDLPPGPHTATAVVRSKPDGAESRRTIEFRT